MHSVIGHMHRHLSGLLEKIFRPGLLLLVLTVALLAQVNWRPIFSRRYTPRAGAQVPISIEGRPLDDRRPGEMSYLIYLPQEYSENETQTWPLLLYLHGSGDRGDELGLVKRSGTPALIERGEHLPLIVVSPQCHENRIWNASALLLLIDSVSDDYRIDRNRVFVTGFGMGSYGTWVLAAKCPDRFAAIVPVGRGADPKIGSRLSKMAVWAFHGALDENIPLSAVQSIVNSVRDAGGNVRLTVFPDRGRDISDVVYLDPNLYLWLLRQRRGDDPSK